MSERELVVIPGVCAGHAEHPELLWMFEVSSSGRLCFSHIEIDFPEHASEMQVEFKKFDVDMKRFEGCPYCEASLYFFCKRCRSLSCFSWDQINSDRQWTCWCCHSTFRMKPKKTPFRVEAQVGVKGEQPMDSSVLRSRSTSQSRGTMQDTQMWHPKIK